MRKSATTRTRRHAARRVLRDRSRTQRAAARIRRNGAASLTSHGIAAGLRPAEARAVASALRRTAAKLGATGQAARVHAGRRMRTTTRYTAAAVAQLAAAYRPRKARYAAARLVLTAPLATSTLGVAA